LEALRKEFLARLEPVLLVSDLQEPLPEQLADILHLLVVLSVLQEVLLLQRNHSVLEQSFAEDIRLQD
jgi:hypothetical protein